MSDYGASTLAGLGATPDELAALAEVLGEVEAEALPGEADGLDYRELDPETGLPPELANASGQDSYDVLDEITHSIGLANTRAMQREADDAVPLPVRSEDRMSWLIDRATRGTYTELSTDDGTGPVCGQGRDELGRCRAKYHDAACMEVLRGEAIAGSAQAMDAWRGVLLSNGRAAIELADATAELDGQTEAALAGPNGVDTYHAMRQILGLG